MSFEADMLLSQLQNHADARYSDAVIGYNNLYNLLNQLANPRTIEQVQFNESVVDPGPVDLVAAPVFSGTYAPGKAAPTIAENLASGIGADVDTIIGKDTSRVEAAVRSFLSSYAPGYVAALNLLETTANAGMTGAVLSTEVEDAMLARKRQTLKQERQAQERQAARAEAARGGDVLQPAYFANLRAIGASHADAMAASNNEVFLWRAEIEVKHKEYCMGVSQQIQNAIIGALVSWGHVFAGYRGAANQLAIAQIEATIKAKQLQVEAWRAEVMSQVEVFRASIQKAGLDIDAYKAEIGAKVDTRKIELEARDLDLKARIAGYEGRLKLETLKKELNQQALIAAMHGFAAAAEMLGRIASAAESVMSGMAIHQQSDVNQD